MSISFEDIKENPGPIVAGIIFIIFIASLPGLYQNNKQETKVINQLDEMLSYSKSVCNNGCKDLPEEYIGSSFEDNARAYCMNQCSNNMKGVKESLKTEFDLELFQSKYTKVVGSTYCLLGLRCSPLRVDAFIDSYK